MPNRPSTPSRPPLSPVSNVALVEPKQELDWQGSIAKSKVLSLIYTEHPRDSLPIHPTVHPSYCSEGVARYRVDFRDAAGGKGKILVSCRVVVRVSDAATSLVECVKSDYR